VDALIAKGIVDPDKLAAMGWSQGGYLRVSHHPYRPL
jgi:dipeptidyl aminopeptidase/acylaminoacyl peptidase